MSRLSVSCVMAAVALVLTDCTPPFYTRDEAIFTALSLFKDWRRCLAEAAAPSVDEAIPASDVAATAFIKCRETEIAMQAALRFGLEFHAANAIMEYQQDRQRNNLIASITEYRRTPRPWTKLWDAIAEPPLLAPPGKRPTPE